jgi:membrane complex biogenesis BtpA family protein
MEALIAAAVADARALEAGGADGICIENDRDQPHVILVTEETRACIEQAVAAVRAAVHIPVGVGVLLNDWKAALDIAHACGGSFVRIDVFVDRVECPDGQGVIEPEADRIVTYRSEIDAEDIAIFADIQVKHKRLLENDKPLTVSAQEAIKAGADAVIVTGPATGQETPIERIALVKGVFPHFPVFVGAGVNANNAGQQLQIADGAFVGTSLKDEYDTIDQSKVEHLSQHFRSL